uniref:Uncharacterized protein n=1 Tax=Timema poppense TaxID=170557 RepID=A0A7R9HD97_TIMPO|nr:unnamed protein product [Timema poppensis]
MNSRFDSRGMAALCMRVQEPDADWAAEGAPSCIHHGDYILKITPTHHCAEDFVIANTLRGRGPQPVTLKSLAAEYQAHIDAGNVNLLPAMHHSWRLALQVAQQLTAQDKDLCRTFTTDFETLGNQSSYPQLHEKLLYTDRVTVWCGIASDPYFFKDAHSLAEYKDRIRDAVWNIPVYMLDRVIQAFVRRVGECGVLHFLMSHNDTVNLVLHSGSPYIQLIFLKELARLTCIISRASQQDVWLVCEPENAGATQLQRMQQLMLALFPSFVVSQALFQELSGTQEGGDAHNSEVVKSVLWFFRIACNLVLFARNIVASQGVDHRATRVIFRPTLGETRTVEMRFRGEFHNSGSSDPPNLGVVVKQLVQCVEHHIREKASLEFLGRKLAFLPSMNATEMKEFLPEATTKTYTLAETCALAEQQLESRITNKKQELQHCMYLIENCLYLLWSHLDYYMLRAIPRTKFGLSYANSVSEGKSQELSF